MRAELERRLLEVFRARVTQQPIRRRAGARRNACASVQSRIVDLLDSWRQDPSTTTRPTGVDLQYQKLRGWSKPKPLLREMLDTDFESEHHRKFRVNRSLRDVEPSVNLFLKDLSGGWVEDGRERAAHTGKSAAAR